MIRPASHLILFQFKKQNWHYTHILLPISRGRYTQTHCGACWSAISCRDICVCVCVSGGRGTVPQRLLCSLPNFLTFPLFPSICVQPNPSNCSVAYLKGEINLQRKGKRLETEKRKKLCPTASKCHIFTEAVQDQEKILLTSMKRGTLFISCDCQRPEALLYGNYTRDNFVWLGMWRGGGTYFLRLESTPLPTLLSSTQHKGRRWHFGLQFTLWCLCSPYLMST